MAGAAHPAQLQTRPVAWRFQVCLCLCGLRDIAENILSPWEPETLPSSLLTPDQVQKET